MSFLEYMVSHLQYFDGSQMFGLFRVILWALVNLISSLCSAAEGIYNHIFSLVGVIYNDNVCRAGWALSGYRSRSPFSISAIA